MRIVTGLKESLKLVQAQGITTPDMNSVRRANGAGIIVAWMGLLCLIMLFWVGFAHADQVYTDSQIVEAIKQAEGKNKKGWYSYGIKSVKCETEEACKKICFNTVRNNRRRFASRIDKSKDFVQFIGSRYCPLGCNNDPKGLNKNWVKNVKYFLLKG